jgi:hypothetical protein
MDWRNDKHYPDPTAALALANVARDEKKPFVFICSPYAGDVELDAMRARRYVRSAIGEGAIPFAPHILYPEVLDDGDLYERKMGLALGLAWLDKCDELWVFGRSISSGMRREIIRAMKLEIRIRYFTEQCEEAS